MEGKGIRRLRHSTARELAGVCLAHDKQQPPRTTLQTLPEEEEEVTERALRDRLVQPALHTYGEVCALCGAESLSGPVMVHASGCPIAKDPDVVKLAQKLLSDEYSWFDGHSQPHITISHRELVHMLRETFRVRLSDEPPGWEWTDE